MTSLTKYYDPFIQRNFDELINKGEGVPYICIFYNQGCQEDVEKILDSYKTKFHTYFVNKYIYPAMNNYVIGAPVIVFFGSVYHQIQSYDEINSIFMLLSPLHKKVRPQSIYNQYQEPIREYGEGQIVRMKEQVYPFWGNSQQ